MRVNRAGIYTGGRFEVAVRIYICFYVGLVLFSLHHTYHGFLNRKQLQTRESFQQLLRTNLPMRNYPSADAWYQIDLNRIAEKLHDRECYLLECLGLS